MNLFASSINKKKRKYFKVFSAVVALLILAFVLNFFSKPLKNYFYILSYPVQKTFFSTGISSAGFLNSLLNFSDLSKENENLKKENQDLLYKISVLASDKESIEALSNFSNSCQEKDFTSVRASQIGFDGQDIVSIDKGVSDGLSSGMPVVDQHGVIFGKIFDVYENFSKVMLISSKNSTIDAMVQRVSEEGFLQQINGVVRGNDSLSIYLDLIQIDQEIKEGDVVLTSALEKVFPKDLLIGKIIKINKDDQKPFQSAELKPFFEVENTDNLFVITNYKQP